MLINHKEKDCCDFKNQKIGIAACSNGLKKDSFSEVNKLISLLEKMDCCTIISPYIYAEDGVFSGSAIERAKVLNGMFQDHSISYIFDISGGDMANEIIDFIDFDAVKKSRAIFWGYSDLTTIINSIYTMTGRSSALYQVRNFIGPWAFLQQNRLLKNELFSLDYSMIQGDRMEGVIIGGNIRCFLKLAGTKYMPDFKGRILLLEAMGGTVPQMVTYLNQLKQMGVYEKINGILLGTFTAMESEHCMPQMPDLVKMYAGSRIPIATTRDIGHGKDAKAIMIGEHYKFD